jgi:hypothetical protein
MREEQRRLHDDVRTLRTQQDKLELRLAHLPAGAGISANGPTGYNGTNLMGGGSTEQAHVYVSLSSSPFYPLIIIYLLFIIYYLLFIIYF